MLNPGVGFRNRTDALICRKQKRELVGGKRYRAAFRNCLQNINSCLVCAIDSGCHCRWRLNDAEAQGRSGRRPVLLIILSCGVCQGSWCRSDALVRIRRALLTIHDTRIGLWVSMGDPFFLRTTPHRKRSLSRSNCSRSRSHCFLLVGQRSFFP